MTKHSLGCLIACVSIGYVTGTSGVAQVLPPQHVAADAIVRLDTHRAELLLARRVTVQLVNASLKDAVDAVATAGRVRVQYRPEVLDAYHVSVTLQVSRISIEDALNQVLAPAGLHVVPLPGVLIGIASGASNLGDVPARPAGGTILGVVRDARTRGPARGVTVVVDDDVTREISSNENGMFRIVDVPLGTHRVLVKGIGYAKAVQTVVVQDGVTHHLEFILDPAVAALDQVVVTGMVIPTELKAVPNAITVITAKQIEERGITKIDQLFHGDIPGLFAQNQGSFPTALLDEVTMFSRGATAFDFYSAGTNRGTNPIKTYVDGVELADPQYLSQIDPRSIERIEILTGPQASTIYGSNAINGVMQIFTKRGSTSKPQLTLNLLSGWVQSNFSTALTPQHDHSAQINDVEGHISYNAGGSWNYIGAWTPVKQTARLNAFGGIRFELPASVGPVSADLTLRRGRTENRAHGSPVQVQTDYQTSGWWRVDNVFGGNGLTPPTTYVLMGQTLGLTLGYVPWHWWSQELGIGQDASDTETRYTARGYTSTDDTTLFLQQTRADRRSLHYTNTARIPLTTFTQATVTTGADSWQTVTSLFSLSPQTLTGSLTSSNYRIIRQPEHNTGAFMQTQLAVMDRCFFTYGLRAEWNPSFGTDASPNYAPRYGFAYTQDIGSLTAKMRASYGRSTRPPQASYKVAQSAATDLGLSYFVASVQPYYGNFDRYLANPELGPEYQQGGEGGLELYWGTRGSLVITRYNQTVDGLISVPIVDSARSLVPTTVANSMDVDGYGYIYQYQYLNIGSIRNQGWELQGSVSAGPVTTKGTYSWTKSRTIGITPKYRSYFTASNFPQYQPGATFQFLPEHTGALEMTYVHATSSFELDVTGAGRTLTAGDARFFQDMSPRIRLPQNRWNVSNTGKYVNANRSYVVADIMTSHRFSSHMEGVLHVQNLTDRYTNDYNASYATIGRQVKTGLRIRLQ